MTSGTQEIISRFRNSLSAAADAFSHSAVMGEAETKVNLLPAEDEQHQNTIGAVALSKDGRLIITSSRDCTSKAWSVDSGDCLTTFRGHEGWVGAVAVCIDGQRAVTGSDDRTVRVWEVSTGTCVAVLTGHSDAVTSIAVSDDGRWAISGGGPEDRALRLWNLKTMRCEMTRGCNSGLLAVAMSAGGQLAISASEDCIQVWDLAKHEVSGVLRGHKDWVRALAITMDGRRALSGSDDGEIKLWDVAGAVCTARLFGHDGGVTSVAFGCNGSRAVSGSRDGRIKVWDVLAGTCTASLQCSKAGVLAVATNGLHAVTSSWDTRVQLWDLVSGQLMDHLPSSRQREGKQWVEPDPEVPWTLSTSGPKMGMYLSFLHHMVWVDPEERDRLRKTHGTTFEGSVRSVPGLRAALRACDLLNRTPLQVLLAESPVRQEDLTDLLKAYEYDAACSHSLKDLNALDATLGCLMQCLPLMAKRGLDLEPIWDILARFSGVVIREHVPMSLARQCSPRLRAFAFPKDTFVGRPDQVHSAGIVPEGSEEAQKFDLVRFCIPNMFEEIWTAKCCTVENQKEAVAKPERFVPWEALLDVMPPAKFAMPLACAAASHRMPVGLLVGLLSLHALMTAGLVALVAAPALGWYALGPLMILSFLLCVDEVLWVVDESMKQQSFARVSVLARLGLREPFALKMWLNHPVFPQAVSAYICSFPNLVNLSFAVLPILLAVAFALTGPDGVECACLLSVNIVACFLKFTNLMRSVPCLARPISTADRIMLKTVPDILLLLVLTLGFSMASHALLTASGEYHLTFGQSLMYFILRFAAIYQYQNPVDNYISELEPADSWTLWSLFAALNIVYAYSVVIIFFNMLIVRMVGIYEQAQGHLDSRITRSCARMYEKLRRKLALLTLPCQHSGGGGKLMLFR